MFVAESVPAVRLGSVSGRPESANAFCIASLRIRNLECVGSTPTSHTANEVHAYAWHGSGECASSSPESTFSLDAENRTNA